VTSELLLTFCFLLGVDLCWLIVASADMDETALYGTSHIGADQRSNTVFVCNDAISVPHMGAATGGATTQRLCSCPRSSRD
jgi:hypothetical protein